MMTALFPVLMIAQTSPGFLSDAERRLLTERFLGSYVKVDGGFDRTKKQLDEACIELALAEAARGSEVAEGMVQKTLLANVALIDPVFGGVFAHSTPSGKKSPWRTPSFEKPLAAQAANLRLYSLAYAQLELPRFREAATLVYRYMDLFLSADEGGFYAGQEADVSAAVSGATYYALDFDGRIELGEPPVIRRVPTADNAKAIAALVAFHVATGDERALALARLGAERMIADRKLPSGGFREEQGEDASLAATIAMADALHALYGSTGERSFLAESELAVAALARFAIEDGGFAEGGAATVEENASITRVANVVHQATGNGSSRSIGKHAILFLGRSLPQAPAALAGVLLADRELEPDVLAYVAFGR
jgi:hypothetical protein